MQIHLSEIFKYMENKNLKYLSLKLGLFFSPVIVLAIVAYLADPFMVFREYDDYYKNNFVTSNREFVCLKLYQKNFQRINYDSFIFGSSRSLAFKVKNWEKFLPPGSKGFHFDASEEGIYGILNKIKYIDDKGGHLKNVLIVLDDRTLAFTKNKNGYLYISPPDLSKESKFYFYEEFIKPFYDPIFVIGYFDYFLFRTHRKYMEFFFKNNKYDNESDNSNGDLYYGNDKLILEDSHKYYNNLIGEHVFYDRIKVIKKHVPLTEDEIKILKEIKKFFVKHNTNYKIVISPLYDQVPLEDGHMNTLKYIFGEMSVYNYSGNNKFTNSIYNYYEDSHFRPNVADEIMSEIYTDNKITNH